MAIVIILIAVVVVLAGTATFVGVSRRRGRGPELEPPPPSPPAVGAGTARKPDEALAPERVAEIEEALRAAEAATALPAEVAEAPAAPPAVVETPVEYRPSSPDSGTGSARPGHSFPATWARFGIGARSTPRPGTTSKRR